MPRERAEPQLQRMVDALRHESFYVTGTWVDEALGVYVGWVARKNSFCDAMPLRNERADVVLAFSGEEFPAPGTVRRLQAQGHTVDPTGPSYLVHLYEEDDAFPLALNGMFHGLVSDRLRGTATLFVDRYGMHRLYYHEAKDAFYFAAEAKALLAVRPELRRVNPRALGEVVACGCALEDRSLFQDVHMLPAGARWVFRGGAIERKETYFDPRQWEQQEALQSDACYEGIRDTLSQNLGRYFSGPERVAMSLTGGLDTRIIMAWHRAAPGSLPCYTFGGMFRDCRDVVVARQVADACGQPHDVIRVGEGFLAQFPRYAERAVYLTDGRSGVDHSPTLYAHEIARQIAPVRMTGNYGGELLRRVHAFKPVAPLPGLFRRDLLTYVDEAQATYDDVLRAHPRSFFVVEQGSWHHSGVLALEQTQISLRSPYLDNDLVRMAFRAPAALTANSDLALRLIADGHPTLRAIRSDRGLAGTPGRFAGAAAHGLQELLFKAEYAYDLGMPQWLARIDRRLSPLRPERLFLGRHKFHHFRLWYRSALARYVKEMLLDGHTLSRPYLVPNTVEEVVKSHLQGDRNYTAAIHQLLTLELLHRLFVDAT